MGNWLDIFKKIIFKNGIIVYIISSTKMVNMSNESLGTVIHGIGASEVIDSSGEVISIEGIDTSSLDVDALINTEHESKTTTQLIGKVVSYKKIFKKEDCENEHHRHFWDKVEAPYLYIKAVLFDKFGHSGALDAVAMMKFDKSLNKDETRQVCGFSIEGSRLDKDGNKITKCIARKISWTAYPCNKTCIAEILEEEDKPIEITAKQLLAAFKKSEKIESNLNDNLSKNEKLKNPKRVFVSENAPKRLWTGDRIVHANKPTQQAKPSPQRTFSSEGEVPSKLKIGDKITYKKFPRGKTGASIYSDPETWSKKSETNNVRKTILKSMSNYNIKTRMMLSEGKKMAKNEILKNLIDETFDLFQKKEELVDFIRNKYPDMSEPEVLGLAKTFVFVQMKKSEMEMAEIANEIEGNDLQKSTRSSRRHAEQVASGKKSKWEALYRPSRGSQKGVHNKAAGLSSEKHSGTSEAGAYVKGNKAKARDYDFNPEKRSVQIDQARKEHHRVIREQKEMPSPNLPKSEQMEKAADYERGVQPPISRTSGTSKAGLNLAVGQKEKAKKYHEKNLANLKQMPSPNLPKSEIEKKDRCWEGYEPTPGKKAYSKGSCRPIKKKDSKVEEMKIDLKKPVNKTAAKGVNKEKFDSCVDQVKHKEGKKVNPYAVCNASLGKSDIPSDEIHLYKYEDGTAELFWGDKVSDNQVAMIVKTELEGWDEEASLEKKEKPFHGYNPKRHSKTGGLSDSFRKKYNREHGSNLKRPVTGKVKAGSKAAKRRKSFCARMSGVKGPTSKEGKLTPKGAALKRWKC